MNEKHYINATEYLHDNWKLAAAIRKSGWRPDFLVGLWRGGAPVAVAIHEFLKATGWSIQHIPLKCASYTGIGENGGEVAFTHGDIVFGMFRRGDKVLVIDDEADNASQNSNAGTDDEGKRLAKAEKTVEDVANAIRECKVS